MKLAARSLFYMMLGILTLAFTTPVIAQEWDLRGTAAAELRVFPASPRFAGQDNDYLSPALVLQPEISYDRGDHRFVFTPFGTLDSHDANRTHADIRELSYLYLGDSWQLYAGIGKVFWGVTESRHLVDIINQDDQVQDIDTEDKLGQPMVQLTLEGDFGAVDFFYLPYFRARTFPEDNARLRTFLPISDQERYDTGAGEWFPSFATRWAQTLGDFDIGTSAFYGIGREPRFETAVGDTGPFFRQVYDRIDQLGLDAQWTSEALLVKLEAITRGGNGSRFAATVAGFEYTLYQLFDSAADLGLLAEYHYDGRDETAPFTVFNQDLFTGFRLALNNADDTEILGGVTTDLENGELFTLLEASHRISNDWLAEYELRYLMNAEPQGIAFAFERDSFMTFRLSTYF